MRRDAAVTGYAWLVVGLLWVVAVFNYLDRLMVTSMRDWIVADIPMSDAQFGLLTSGFLWIYGLVSPIGGYLADRYSRKWVILASLAVWSAMTLLTGRMHTFGSLLAARAVMGVSEACYISAALALITDYHAGGTRSLAVGLHQSGLYTGAALGGAGGFVAAGHGWRSAFAWFGAIGCGYALLLCFALKEARAPAPMRIAGSIEPAPGEFSVRESLRSLFTAPAFWLLVIYFSLAGTAFWLVNGWQPVLLQEKFVGGNSVLLWPMRLTVTAGTAGLWATVPVQVASFLGILAGGAWADRWARRNPRGRFHIVTAGFLAGGPCLLLLAFTPILALALLGMVIFGLGRGFSDANLMPIVCQVLDPRYRATAYGFMNLASVTVGGLMIFAGGWLRDQHVSLVLPYSIAAAGLFAAGGLMDLVSRQKLRSD